MREGVNLVFNPFGADSTSFTSASVAVAETFLGQALNLFTVGNRLGSQRVLRPAL